MASKGRKQKVKFQWTKELGFLIGALVVIIAATIILAIPTKAEKLATKYNEAIFALNSTGNSSISTISLKDHVFEEIQFEDIEKLQNEIKENDSYVFVVYGSELDTDVLQQLANINNKAETCEVETVYIYSSTWVREQEDLVAVEEELLNKEITLLGHDVEEFTFEKAALLVFDKDGKVVFNSQTAEHITSWAGYIDFAFDNFKNKAE
jgi:hypothetical protein